MGEADACVRLSQVEPSIVWSYWLQISAVALVGGACLYCGCTLNFVFFLSCIFTFGFCCWNLDTSEAVQETAEHLTVAKVVGKIHATSSTPTNHARCDDARGRQATQNGGLVDLVSDPAVQVTAASAAGGAIALGAGGGTVGLTVGGAVGALCGVVPAVFTFGLSIPVGAVIGSSAGLCIGTAVGGTTGLIGGGLAGGAYAKREEIQQSLNSVWGDVRATAEESVKTVRNRFGGAGEGTHNS
mmetsp:Transcript_45913/g.106742  ORF Transcript_45913/g.106742 Transcript_45913/m.106742 type:complete len:242 (+) Transcript_45913:29-754(+)